MRIVIAMIVYAYCHLFTHMKQLFRTSVVFLTIWQFQDISFEAESRACHEHRCLRKRTHNNWPRNNT